MGDSRNISDEDSELSEGEIEDSDNLSIHSNISSTTPVTSEFEDFVDELDQEKRGRGVRRGDLRPQYKTAKKLLAQSLENPTKQMANINAENVDIGPKIEVQLTYAKRLE